MVGSSVHDAEVRGAFLYFLSVQEGTSPGDVLQTYDVGHDLGKKFLGNPGRHLYEVITKIGFHHIRMSVESSGWDGEALISRAEQYLIGRRDLHHLSIREMIDTVAGELSIDTELRARFAADPLSWRDPMFMEIGKKLIEGG